jgi:hypothetical protein
MLTETRKLLYNAVILTDKSKNKLRALFGGGRHDKWYGHHVTLQFKPEQAPVNEGEEVTIKITGYASNEKAEAVSVQMDNAESTNDIPHITLSTRPDVKPFYSNELLSDGRIKLSGIKLKGIVTAVYAD